MYWRRSTLITVGLLAALTLCTAQIQRNQVRRDAYGAAWNGDLYRAGSADAVYDRLQSITPDAGNDPDVSTLGQIGRDTNDHALRGTHDGSGQFIYGMRTKTIQFTVIAPRNLDCNDLLPVWSNGTPFDFICDSIQAWSDIDDCDFVLKEIDQDGGNVNTIGTITISTNGTGIYYTTAAMAATVEAGHLIYYDADATDDPYYVKITIVGHFDGDKN
jgi:hypothetical protein